MRNRQRRGFLTIRAVALAAGGAVVCALPAAPGTAGKIQIGAAPQQDIDSDSARVWRDQAGAVREFRLWNGKSAIYSAAAFFPAHARSLGLSEDDTMVAVEPGAATSPTGPAPGSAPHGEPASGSASAVLPPHPTSSVEHLRYQQRWKGIPVEWAQFAITTVRGTVADGHGHLATRIAASTAPTVAAATALASAMRASPGARWAWVADPAHVAAPTGSLRIFSPDFGATKPFRLAWRFEMPVVASLPSPRVQSEPKAPLATPAPGGLVSWVDALDGTLLASQSRVLGLTETSATGTRLDGAKVSFTTTAEPAARVTPQNGGVHSYWLQESAVRRIGTQDVGAAAPKAAPRDFSNVGTHWAADDVRRGVSAHWAAEQFWDLIARDYGWYPFVDPLTIQVGGACVDDGTLAYWPGTTPAEHWIFVCSLPGSASSPFGQTQMVGHEFTHLLNYYGRSRVEAAPLPEALAVEEGLSDALGFVFCNRVLGKNPDRTWTAAAGTREARSLADPLTTHRPATYGGQYWNPAGDTHANAMVLGHWFYLLVEGGAGTNDLGTPYDVAPVGMDAAARLLVTTIRSGLAPTIDYQEIRDTTIALATTDALDPANVEAAWDAVGVSDPLAPAIPHWPGPGELAVAPWPLTATFARPLRPLAPGASDEVQWQVQISTQPDFASGVVMDQTVSGDEDTPPIFLKPMTVYWWRVKAYHERDQAWDKDWAFTSAFETSRMQPRDATPSSGESDVAPWPTRFEWAPVDGAESYDVELADDAAFTENVQRPPRVSEAHVELFARPLRAQYWRVRAWPASGTEPGDWSTLFQAHGFSGSTSGLEPAWKPELALQFETNGAAPEGLVPAAGATAEPWRLALQWRDVGAEKYRIEVRREDDGAASQPYSTSAEPKDGIVSFTVDLIHASQYSWHVQGHRGEDDGAWSSWTQLTTGDAQVTAQKPVDESSTCPWPARLVWQKLAGAESYDVEVAVGDSTIHQPIVSVPNAALVLGLPLPAADLMLPYQPTVIVDQPVVYYWHARAHGPQADTGEWSSPASFRPSSCTRVRNLAPTGTVGVHPIVTWSPPESPAIAGYGAQVLGPDQSASTAPYTSRAAGTLDFDPGLLSPDTVYRARVWAVGASQSGFGEATEVQFTTAKACDKTYRSAWNQGLDLSIDVGKPGTFSLTFNAFEVPDEIRVLEAATDAPLAEPPCAPGLRTLTARTATGVIRVQITVRCNPQIQGDTRWELTVGCVP